LIVGGVALVNIRKKFLLANQSSSSSKNVGGAACFSEFPYLINPFRRYSRSKSKVVRNRGEFWTFCPSKF